MSCKQIRVGYIVYVDFEYIDIQGVIIFLSQAFTVRQKISYVHTAENSKYTLFHGWQS